MKTNVRQCFLTLTTLTALALSSAAVTSRAGDLYYTDSQAKVFRINPNGGRHLVATVNTPTGLAFDSSGDLFVTDYQDNLIYRFDARGARTVFARNRLLSNPSGLAFDSAGNLWVAHNGIVPGITKITPDGTKTLFAQKVEPTELAFDTAGNLYATDFLRNVVFKYTPDGSRTTFAGGFGQPVGLAFDAEGNLYVSDLVDLAIYKISPDGTKSIFATGLSQPLGITFDPEGNLYVADYPNILKIAPDGTKTVLLSHVVPTCLAFRP